MIHHDIEQGGDEWRALRLGLPTASRFSDILSPVRLKPSKSQGAYIAELIAEWALGEAVDGDSSQFMKRGNEQEPQARAWYEFEHDVDVKPGGFVTLDSGLAGCSPDGLIGENGGLELKVPGAKKHVEYLLGDPATQYRLQIQGSLWIAEREFWDFLSFNPAMPNVEVRHERDEEVIQVLSLVVAQFCDQLEEAKQTMRNLGCMGFEETKQAEIAQATAERVARDALGEAEMFGEAS